MRKGEAKVQGQSMCGVMQCHDETSNASGRAGEIYLLAAMQSSIKSLVDGENLDIIYLSRLMTRPEHCAETIREKK